MREQMMQKLSRFHEDVEEDGRQLRGKIMPEITEELYGIYEKNGNRLIFEQVYFARRKYLVTFGLLTVWHRKAEDLAMLETVIRNICGERSWALPAHVNRSEPDWENTVDLFASETGQTLSELMHVLGDVMSKESLALIRGEVTRRLLESYLSKPMGGWRWEHFYNNWMAVCAGSLGSMAIYLWDEEREKQENCLNRVIQTLDQYLESMMEDGTCPEGLSYFTYGMSYFVGFADLLFQYTKGRQDLLDSKKVEKVARFQQICYFPGGKTVSFSDGSQKDCFNLGLTCYLAMRYPGMEIPDLESAMEYHSDGCYRWISLYRQELWIKAYLEREKKEQGVHQVMGISVLPDAQWVIGKSENGCGMGCKGGCNEEPHNHNDVGSFFYLAGDEMFLADLGCGEYTKDYFGDKRYTILCNRSRGHSVPIINEKEQSPGKEYRASSFFTDETECMVEISFANAYEAGSLTNLTRKFNWDKRQGELSITDVYHLSKKTVSLTENLVTQVQPEICGNQIVLRGRKKMVVVQIPEEAESVRIEKECFVNHAGLPEDVWCIRWDVCCDREEVVCHMVISVVEG